MSSVIKFPLPHSFVAHSFKSEVCYCYFLVQVLLFLVIFFQFDYIEPVNRNNRLRSVIGKKRLLLDFRSVG